MKDNIRWTIIVIASVILLLMAGTVMFLITDTIVNPWLFFGVIAVPAFGSGALLASRWRPLTRIHNFAVNFLINGVVVGIVISALVLGVNYFAADFDGADPRTGIMERKYTKTRYRSKRVTRRTYTRGEPYKVYFIEVDLPESGVRSFEVRHELYSALRSGDTVTYRETRGALGLEVISHRSITPLHPRSNYSTRRKKR